ncbi:transcriptional regulator, TetR family [Prosthecobacter debontii]|uniref:Transcriptional regulator, TetR family n=1 Tax=Prosthecobacter debontii TaxID=48467 RepID=A0A1T4Y1A9_9BACT|nr:TetR/AcrR family transcriptional regulator [Prosthecobacter debontii]SKA95258.1 transcriptional regulator, TetR family [Prosthecobacter debontii]
MPPAASAPRLPGDERRERILEASLRVFAERGFHGATTRELAKAAGVSEALMFRHFPTKEDLYLALQSHCCQAKAGEKAAMLGQLEDCTASLVTMVHYMMAKMLRPPDQVPEVEQALHRLLAHSLIEDGNFARGFMEKVGGEFIQKLEACLAAALQAGDAVASPVQARAGAWFVQHFAAMLMLNEMPGTPVVRLDSDRSSQVEQAVWFTLQGLGLKPEAIRRNYHPQAFALLMS